MYTRAAYILVLVVAVIHSPINDTTSMPDDAESNSLGWPLVQGLVTKISFMITYRKV